MVTDDVKIERLGSDMVKLSNDDQQWLIVSREGQGRWLVRRHTQGGSGPVSAHATADGAIESARAFLQRGKDELDQALRG